MFVFGVYHFIISCKRESMETFALVLLVFSISCAKSSGFYVTTKRYTWHDAVRNPPCHIVGMTNESIVAFSLIDADREVIIYYLIILCTFKLYIAISRSPIPLTHKHETKTVSGTSECEWSGPVCDYPRRENVIYFQMYDIHVHVFY